MAHQQTIKMVDPPSSDSPVTRESKGLAQNESNSGSLLDLKESHNGDVDNIQYPPPWKWEKYFIGGYSQGRMIKFKNPKNMYKAINLFAGVAIMFYGYDQGVMSQVNLNEDYWNHSETIHHFWYVSY